MRIARLETFSRPDVALVRLTTDGGEQGWGQISPYHSDIAAQVLHRQVAPWVLGKDIDDPERLFDEVLLAEFKFPGSYVRRAFGGFDTALWDLKGKLEGRSVCELLGGDRRPLEVYASSMRRDIHPTEEGRRLARLQQEHGFRSVKVRIGRENGKDEDEWPGRTEEIIATIPAGLDPNTRLMVDANCGFRPHKAIEVGRRLAAAGFSHLEEPCPYWEYEQTALVREALDELKIEVAGGEQDCELATWRRMIERRVFDVAQPDVLYLGGLTPSLALCRMAAEAGLPILPHSANLAMGVVFTLHLVASIPNGRDLVEWSIEGSDYYPWQYDLYDPVPVVADGMVVIPDGPGWGIEPRRDWLEASQRQVSEL